jgi:hypothetical protein
MALPHCGTCSRRIITMFSWSGWVVPRGGIALQYGSDEPYFDCVRIVRHQERLRQGFRILFASIPSLAPLWILTFHCRRALGSCPALFRSRSTPLGGRGFYASRQFLLTVVLYSPLIAVTPPSQSFRKWKHSCVETRSRSRSPLFRACPDALSDTGSSCSPRRR